MAEDRPVFDPVDRPAAPRDESVAEPADGPAKPPRRWKGIAIAAALIALAGIGAALGWLQMEDGLLAEKPAEVPLIRAEAAPIKVRPESPGGMEIPDRDKLVYGRLSTSSGPPPVERLLPEPEQPMPPPTLKPQAEAPKPLSPTPSVERVMAAKPPPPAPPAASSPPQPAKSVAPTGNYRVQLAAVKSAARASEEWARLRKAHGDVLGTLTDSVIRADLGAKGVFYRLRAGPLAGEAEAKAVCARLSKRQVPCMVVRPNG